MSEIKEKPARGMESLRAAVLNDTQKAENCFSENGCTKVRHLYLPEDKPSLLEMGIKTKCVSNTKCTHDYCGKYKWILDRAKIYAEKTGKTVEQIIEIWETDRTYSYMNYYQEAKQPIPNAENIMDYDLWIAELKERFGNDAKKWAFKCPMCGNVQTAQDFINNKVEEPENKVYFSCIGRYVKGKGCDWTLGGLLQIHKMAVMKDAIIFPVFEMAEK